MDADKVVLGQPTLLAMNEEIEELKVAVASLCAIRQSKKGKKDLTHPPLSELTKQENKGKTTERKPDG